MRQLYSGAASSYWASKGYLGLLLPEAHAVWSAAEERPTFSDRDLIAVLPAPGFLISRTSKDGIARLVNHGSDHAPPLTRDDEPGYSRFAYSSVTAPAYTGAEIWDNHATVIDKAGYSGRRVDFERVATSSGLSSSFCPVWESGERGDADIRVTTVPWCEGKVVGGNCLFAAIIVLDGASASCIVDSLSITRQGVSVGIGGRELHVELPRLDLCSNSDT